MLKGFFFILVWIFVDFCGVFLVLAVFSFKENNLQLTPLISTLPKDFKDILNAQKSKKFVTEIWAHWNNPWEEVCKV